MKKQQRRPARKVKRSGRPRGHSREETRRAILAAARDCFAKNGFDRATNRDIARAAGVTAAAMYRHFDSKPELYSAVVHEAFSELLPELRSAIASQPSARGGFRALLEGMESLDVRQHAGTKFLSELPNEMQRHPEIASRIVAAPGAVYALVNELVETGVQRGEIPQHKAQRVISVIIATMMGVAGYANTLGWGLGKHAVAGFLDLLEGGLFGSFDA
ncbi:MAG TPA: TetR/AcrR family transcriptional regulator [Polyangiales bacterium]|nr:TetR/AcrR family transcriptional regulator [Polyangiales bacterium]